MAQKAPYLNENGKLVTLLVDGVETQYDGGEVPAGGVLVETEPFGEFPCNFTMSGKPTYRAGLVIDAQGIARAQSASAVIQGGAYDGERAKNIRISSTSHNFNGVMVVGGKYEISDSEFDFDSISDGSDVCDFNGYGAVLGAFKGGRLILDRVKVRSAGVAKPAVYCDSSDVVLKDSYIKVAGGRLYDGYVNSADVSKMVAPPWVLGITGNARGTNLVGKDSSFIVVNSDTNANQWGVLSTDVGSGMQMCILDSSLTLLGENLSEVDRKNPYLGKYGSGYGTYVLGTDELFCGAEINVGTYAVNLSGGNAVFKSSRGHFLFRSKLDGAVLYEGDGKGRPSVIHSDVFGFMAHSGGRLTVTDGTQVHCTDAPFHLKSGGVHLEISDGASFHTPSDVLIQLIDDDDDVVGTDPGAEYDLTFNTEFFEKPGWPSENGQITSKMELPPPPPPPSGPPPGADEGFAPPPPPEPDSHVLLKNVALQGNIYNGTGYFGIEAKQLYVTIGAGASLRGAISATEVMHIDEHGNQNTHFTKEQYYYLGHVRHRNFFNGDNILEVTVAQGGTWEVTGPGILSALTLEPGGVLLGTVTVDGAPVIPEAGKTYRGTIEVNCIQ